MAASIKTLIAEDFAENRGLPATEADLGLTAEQYSTDYIDKISVADGIINISYRLKELGDNKVLQLAPTCNSDGTLTWECQSPLNSGVQTKYLPAVCGTSSLRL